MHDNAPDDVDEMHNKMNEHAIGKKQTHIREEISPLSCRDMWDRLTASTPTVTLESTFRQGRFTVLLFPDPPRSACRFTCVSALYRGVCLRSLWDSPGPVAFEVVS